MFKRMKVGCGPSPGGHYMTHLRGIKQYKSMLIFRDFPYYNLGGGFKYFLFKQASACQPPTREICCIGPGIVDS